MVYLIGETGLKDNDFSVDWYQRVSPLIMLLIVGNIAAPLSYPRATKSNAFVGIIRHAPATTNGLKGASVRPFFSFQTPSENFAETDRLLRVLLCVHSYRPLGPTHDQDAAVADRHRQQALLFLAPLQL